MQQVKELGAGEERWYGVEWGEKQISFPACLPWLFRPRGEEGPNNGSEGEEGAWRERGEKVEENVRVRTRWGKVESRVKEERNGGNAMEEMCERETRSAKEMMTEESRKGPGECEESRQVNQWRRGRDRAGCFTKPPGPHPFELWLLFLPANSFSRLPPSVRADSADTQCFQLSHSWQSVHHTLK